MYSVAMSARKSESSLAPREGNQAGRERLTAESLERCAAASSVSRSRAACSGSANSLQPDRVKRFIAGRVREEASQLAHQTLGERYAVRMEDGLAPDFDSDHLESIRSSEAKADLDKIRQMYRLCEEPGPEPMLRFATFSAIDEPFPLLTKRAMSDSGVDYGSLESVQARAVAATSILQTQHNHGTSDNGYLDCRTNSIPSSSLARVYKTPRCRKRLASRAESEEDTGKRSRSG
ncbi:hypothetical protein BAUCODRAFT_292679 [Baudoinia panamericana UAMH 10762]|uniref:Uncharacterized protein n=1 Tax=Baudoinia panamericana (strain UAMH 10762) TaxID=717646 RepID=M2MM85_BAUPA|nr:uncharacterized protein BAUCODRAFT_292679 [Baudoinia panamericana UAMH 10762]EMC92483.1 hypothetical protein BAUCODRAFT_292679 [Baudoinia panamericana UAMH 10762]